MSKQQPDSGDCGPEDNLLIDCDTCAVAGDACSDCVVSLMLGPPAGTVELDPVERQALANFAEAGMMPALRLVPVSGRRAG